MTNVRVLTTRVINQVLQGTSLSACLNTALATLNDSRDKALTQAMCYGVCRYYSHLNAILACLLTKPMKAKDSDIHALLLIGLYQLVHLRIPVHAAVAVTVNATDYFKKPWARKLVNAILRQYLRKNKVITSQLSVDPVATFAHPLWWIQAIKQAWPLQHEAIMYANNSHPPFALRVNQRHLSRTEYIAQLAAKGLVGELISGTQHGVMLTTPISITELPGFLPGHVSVQDGAAQLAAEWLDVGPNQRVLDACAAPGGKLTHILEMHQPTSITCIAIEQEPARIHLLKDNLSRLALQADCICTDANAVTQWWDGQLFDRILLDVPCSGSGVIRRHPDIKLLRQATDIAQFSSKQKVLLHSLWPLLKPGGLLMYVTCSIFPEENVEVVESLLTSLNAIEVLLPTTLGVACKVGRQILPGMHNMDGFYYAKIKKSV